MHIVVVRTVKNELLTKSSLGTMPVSTMHPLERSSDKLIYSKSCRGPKWGFAIQYAKDPPEF